MFKKGGYRAATDLMNDYDTNEYVILTTPIKCDIVRVATLGIPKVVCTTANR